MRHVVVLFLCAASVGCGDDSSGPKVEEPTVASLSLSNTPASMVPAEEVTVQVVARAANGSTIATPTLTWSTSNQSVATVSQDGVLRGVAPGTARVQVASGAVNAGFDVTVDPGGMVGPAGATLTAFSDGVRLVVPAGAVTAPIAVRFGSIPTTTPDPTFVLGSGLSLTFSGTFAVPAQLTLNYGPNAVPTGLNETRLGLRRYVGDQWVPISGGSVDAVTHTVTGAITASGNYGVGMAPATAACSAAEHRQFDFRLGSYTWSGPTGQLGLAEITADASGCWLLETLRINGGTDVHALLLYEPSNSQWHYTSIAGTAVTRLSGGMEGDRMILYNSNRTARVVWERISDVAHRQAGETSTDGTNWTRQGSGVYTDVNAPAPNVLTPAGGTITLADGAVTLTAPAGAVTQNVSLAVTVTPTVAQYEPWLVRGAVYTVTATPSVTFQQPVTLQVSYNPANGPSGVDESTFRLARVSGNSWEIVPNGQVDVGADKVSAPVTTLGVFAAGRAPATTDCTAPEHRQFDFWLGEWDVPTQQGSVHSSITREQSGCAVFELWRGPPATPGKSINVYDPVTGKWHQTYLANSNAQPLIMTGGLEDGKMVLYVRLPDGQLAQRWTWTKVDDNTVIQRAENTTDNGASWTQGFVGTYTRR